MKKTVALILAVLMVLSTGVCSMAAADAKESYKVYIIAPQASGGSWGLLDKGMQDACASFGWEGTYLAPVTPYDNVAMADLCQTAVNAGADVLMTFTADESMFADVLEECKNKGVLTVAIAKPNFACDLRVGTDDANLGENMAVALVEAMGDNPIQVVELMTDVTSEGQLRQVIPFEEKLKELSPDAVIIGRENSGSNAATAADDLSAMYVSNPEMNCVVSFDSIAALGAVSFKTDRMLDDFVIIGIDDNSEILVNIQQGYIYSTVAQQWYQYGIDAVTIAHDILVNGAQYDFFQNINTEIIHSDEVEAYAAEKGISLD